MREVRVLGPLNLAPGYPLIWPILIRGPDEPSRVRLRLFGRRYRQSSAGSVADHTHTQGGTGAAGGHSHTAVVINATATAADSITFVPLLDGTGLAVADTKVSHPGGAAANIPVPTSSIGDHTHTNPATDAAGGHTSPPAIAEDTAPNGNLAVTIDGISYKTGLGDGTEKLLLDEKITALLRKVGEHTLTLDCGGRGAILAELILEW